MALPAIWCMERTSPASSKSLMPCSTRDWCKSSHSNASLLGWPSLLAKATRTFFARNHSLQQSLNEQGGRTWIGSTLIDFGVIEENHKKAGPDQDQHHAMVQVI